MTSPDLDEFLDRYRRAVDAFVAGDFEPEKPLWSKADDATLANPLGPVARGWDAIVDAADRAAAALHDGKPLPAERISFYATADLAYTVEIERCTLSVGDAAAPSEVSLRVTTVFRREADGWKIVHRHADPITSARPPESMIQQ
jgi:ketosteroid isomerase-like protein